jgi:transposase
MTFTPEESEEIFKRDKMGRVRVPRARREALLDEYERGGISALQFANYVGIKYSTLANWIQERRGRGRFDKTLVKGSEGAEESTKAKVVAQFQLRIFQEAAESVPER